ncbi:META domain-containing protein [Streptomyces sp. P9(2023)]|uniref:META domain-containing protein n=1 Tax=Streptomyces sp. P9(2023) TaxID=3064394 RepID=UPI0028F439AE|nr:META domain-containing protein [Streptomyces sp. P9(2023)]MDT9691804.1 META domain-containing protein [Streptomyces sp. P9(2023)]
MLKTRTTAAAAVLASLVVLSACGTQKSGSDPGAGTVAPDVPVTGVHWSFDTVTVAGEESRAPAGAHIKIAANGQASGNSGCNGFGAEVSVEGDTVTVKPGQGTEMACPGERGAFETVLQKALAGSMKARLEGDRLTLTSPDGKNVVALTSEPPAPLRGTTWTVDSLLSGDTATSLPQGSEGKATFVIDKDGKVRGNLGCNRFTATAKVTPTTLTVTGPVVTTRMMCSSAQMELETKLYELLDGPLSYELGHRSLGLTAADGEGFAATTTTPTAPK